MVSRSELSRLLRFFPRYLEAGDSKIRPQNPAAGSSAAPVPGHGIRTVHSSWWPVGLAHPRNTALDAADRVAAAQQPCQRRKRKEWGMDTRGMVFTKRKCVHCPTSVHSFPRL
mmetsp:Transcript_20987/g.57817  ORF Transcript_20987/g.57817 Transcript_20987/m.57817 type:complete len:113 (+) Transcript_20987:975-1313(+)